MKILIVASNMVHIKNFHMPYVDAFKEKGHEVYVMANTSEADFEIPFKKRAFSFKNFLLSLKIRKILKKERFDVVYLHTSLAAFWTRIAVKGLKNRPSVVNTVHGYLFSKEDKSFKKRLYLFAERFVRKVTDHILVMNGEDFEIATENKLCLGDVIQIDGMGIDESRIRFDDIPSTTSEKIRLSYVGEISKRKNQIFLIKALTRLNNAHLTLVGDGNERGYIEKTAKRLGVDSRLTITGFTKGVREYIANTDIYVSASKIEGLPFNILEAMGAHLPIVASDIKGQRDLLDAKFLYPLDDEDAFVELINGIAIKRTEYNVDRYTQKAVLDKNVEIYLSLDKIR